MAQKTKLRVSRNVNKIGVLAELGWSSIERDILIAKLNLLGRIKSMQDHRWLKLILNEAMQTGNKTT